MEKHVVYAKRLVGIEKRGPKFGVVNHCQIVGSTKSETIPEYDGRTKFMLPIAQSLPLSTYHLFHGARLWILECTH